MSGIVLPGWAGVAEAARLGPVDKGEIAFTYDGRAYAIDVPADGRAVCAWARDGAWPLLVPGCMASWCSEAFADLLTDPTGPVDLRVCWQLALDVAPKVYGVPWWTAGRIAMSIEEHWDSYAPWAVSHGFDPAGAPAHRVTASGLAWLRSGVQEEKDARRLESLLFAPPKPTRRRSKSAKSVPGFTPQDQAAAFQSALAQLGDGTG